MSEVTGAGNPAGETLSAHRTRYKFKIPEGARIKDTDPKEVVLVEVLLSEQKEATRVAEASKSAPGFELLKHAVVEVDGRPLTWAGDEKTRFVDGCSSRVRTLLLSAFTHIHSPTAEDEKDFLSSMAAQV